jgi:hypothetical protein
VSNSEAAPILNAGQVIERFGGIRPMAKKIDVAVTTIQGWKKRDVIPAARHGDIMKAAAQYNVDLSDLIVGAPPVNQNEQPTKESRASVVQSSTDASAVTATKAESAMPKAEKPVLLTESMEKRPGKISRAMWINLILAFLAILALAAMLFPQRIDISQGTEPAQVAPEKPEHSFLGPLIPENLDEQLASLKEQAGVVQENLGHAVEKAQEISDDVLGENAGTLEQRYTKLEGHMVALANTPELQAMAGRIQSWGLQPMGQEKLDSAMAELAALVGALSTNLPQPGAFESALQTVRENNVNINHTFEGVPQEDLKAAALLLGMTQFRESMGRDRTPFADDLQVLTGLIGEDAPELKASLERLAPYAEQGILTPSGLTTELKEVTGETVVASLKGEDVSLTERAKAKINEVLQIEKNGELVTGTDTQARMTRAQKLMEAGDIEGAIAQVQGLEDPAAQAAAAPWVQNAEATLSAKNAQALLDQTLNVGGIPAVGSQVIHNEETGINIYKPGAVQSMQKATPKDANPFE